MRTVTEGRHVAREAVVTVPIGVLPSIAFSPPLSAAKRAAGERNHAGQGVKAWVLARGVPEYLCPLGHGTRLDFAGAHTALRWPSFMDGAIESGHRVADEVDRGISVTWPRTMDHP